MTSELADLIRQRRTAMEVTGDVGGAYRWAFDKLIEDLKARLRLRSLDMDFAGLVEKDGQANVLADIHRALMGLKANLREIAPDVADYASERLSREIGGETQSWLASVAASAPENIAPRIVKMADEYSSYMQTEIGRAHV